MTNRQRLFAEYYAQSGNATASAKAAGFSEKTAYSSGQRLLKDVEILEYIKQIQAEADAERIASISEIKSFWTNTMRDREEKTESRLKASELLAKSAGEFVQHVEVDADIEAAVEEDVIFYIPHNGREVNVDDG